MKFERTELEYIRKILEPYCYSDSIKKMNRFISELLNDADCNDEYDLINRSNYISSHYNSYILCLRIKSVFSSHNIAATDENIQSVLSKLYAENMVDAHIGWDVIDDAIRKVGLMK